LPQACTTNGAKRFYKQAKGDTTREANSDEVSELRQENDQLKQLVAELSLKNRVLKKSLHGLE
jgi:transposase|tara:strand:- start:492 stop:680 length:189 start_codon:yes stop_codon:yes gene_type:complete